MIHWEKIGNSRSWHGGHFCLQPQILQKLQNLFIFYHFFLCWGPDNTLICFRLCLTCNIVKVMKLHDCGCPDVGSLLPPLAIFLSTYFVLTTDLWPPGARGAHSADSQTFLLYYWILHPSWWALHPDSELLQKDPWTFPLILPALSGGFCFCPPVFLWSFTKDSCARSPAQHSSVPTH